MKKRWLLIGILLLFACGCEKKEEKVLNVLNWSSYIPEEVIHSFEEETGVKVHYGTYSSNEELLAKISSSNPGTYDVIFPSDYMVELMKEKDLIQKIDFKRLHHLDHFNSSFLNQEYDQQNLYSYPFLSTIVVLVKNQEKIKEEISSYNDLLNPKFKNNIVLLDDQRIVIGLSLLASHLDMNSVNPDDLKVAKDWLLRLKPNIKAYDSDSPKSFFLTDEVDLGVMWNAEAELAKKVNPNLEIIYPIEGHAISTDNYCLVKNAKHLDEAYLFLDYLMQYEVAQDIVKEYPYISPLKIVQESSVNEQDIFTKGYYVKNIGPSIKNYDKIWADIK